MFRKVFLFVTALTIAACNSPNTIGDHSGADAGNDAGNDAGTDAGPSNGPRLAVVDIYAPTALTSDGMTAVLGDRYTGDVWLYDVATGSLTFEDSIGDPSYNLLNDVSGNGKRMIAYIGDQSSNIPTEASIWEEGKGWKGLGNLQGYQGCQGDSSSGFGLNEDGTVAVGMLWENCTVSHAFRWTDVSGQGVFTPLQHMGDGYERATVVSADGSVAGGFSQQGEKVDRSPTLWFADNTGLLLEPTPTIRGEVRALSRDGKMAAGTWNSQGFYWTREKGVQLIGKLPGQGDADIVTARSIPDSGKLIFGSAGDAFNGISYAYVWTEAGGMQRLQDIAVQNGITLPAGYHMSHVMSASADGSVVLGILTQGGVLKTFVLTLPVSAYGL